MRQLGKTEWNGESWNGLVRVVLSLTRLPRGLCQDRRSTVFHIALVRALATENRGKAF
jgi:hypothetical protein